MLYNLQALRALAAFMVVVHHMRGSLGPVGLPGAIFDAGAAGVDIFFVISGFVMTHSVMQRTQYPVEFALNRIIRVVPLYWIATLSLGTCVMVAPTLFQTISATSTEILKSLFFVPYVSTKGDPYPVLYVGWTLNFEIIFYAVFTCSIAVYVKKSLHVVMLSTSILAAMVGAGFLFQPDSLIGKTYTDPILLEFGFGMALALLYPSMGRAGIVTGTLVLLAGIVLLGLHFTLFPDVSRVIGAGVPAALIILGSLCVERHHMALRNGFLQLLGASSYALYLVHVVPLGAASRLTASMTNVYAVCGLVGILTAVIIAISCFVHLFVEKPITGYIRRVVRNRLEPGRLPPTRR